MTNADFALTSDAPAASASDRARLADLLSSMRQCWMFYCDCGHKWSMAVDDDTRAPRERCPECMSLVRGGL